MLRVGRNRARHTRMPKGWAPAKSGAIYFRPTNAEDRAIVKTITGGPLSLKLGADEDEAHRGEPWRRVLAARAPEVASKPGTVAELVERAKRSYLPRIQNLETRAWRARHVEALGKVFGARRYAKNVYDATKAPPGTFLLSIDVQRHLDEHAATRHAAANREAKTWGLVFAEARRRWGLTEYNPCAGLAFNPEPPRDVLPRDRDIFRVYRRLDPPARFMVAVIRYYGRRRGEILGLTLSSAQEDGLHFTRGKRRREIVIRWDRRLERAWARLMVWRAAKVRGGKVQTTAALVNRRGRRFSVTAFASAWRRAQERAGVRGNFTFHDIRASSASAAGSVAEAQMLLAHDEQRTTQAVYRRGAHVVDLADSRNDSRNSRKGRS